MQQELGRQAKEMQRIYLMLMASQLTMACVTTHSTPEEVGSTFGEVYELMELYKQPVRYRPESVEFVPPRATRTRETR